jgi:hypothetical protein
VKGHKNQKIMEIKRDEDRYYRTTNLSLATFLFAQNEQIAGINEVDNSTDKQFVFSKTMRLEELVQAYRFGEKEDADLLVNVRSYEEGRRFLLDRINGK